MMDEGTYVDGGDARIGWKDSWVALSKGGSFVAKISGDPWSLPDDDLGIADELRRAKK